MKTLAIFMSLYVSHVIAAVPDKDVILKNLDERIAEHSSHRRCFSDAKTPQQINHCKDVFQHHERKMELHWKDLMSLLYQVRKSKH